MTNLTKSLVCIVFFCTIPASLPAQINKDRLFNDLKILSHDSMEGRKTGTLGNEKARNFILKRIREIGLLPLEKKYVQPFQFAVRDSILAGENILAFVPGESHPDQYIVLSAHYDHVGIRSGQIYNGADDNASGVAGLLAVSEYLSKNKPVHSIIFAFFDAEESGLQGSKAFVNSNSRALILNINLDMISRNDLNEIFIAGTYQNPDLKSMLMPLISGNDQISILFGHDKPGSGGHDWTNSSDHAPFNAIGIPFLYFGVEDHEDYHKPGDDFDKIDLNFYGSVVEMLLEVIRSVDKHLQ